MKDHRKAEEMAAQRMQLLSPLQPVVIVDEAHLLDKEMLEEVRFC